MQFAEAFADLGGVAGLVQWGKRYPKEFYAIWARVCIPRNMVNDSPAENSLEALLAQMGEDDE